MEIQFINEFQISAIILNEISNLLQATFNDIDYKGEDYFKQIPHYRLLGWKDDELIGNLGIDYRIMSLDDSPIRVFGVKALAVKKKYRGNGYGKDLLLEFERIAKENPSRIDFLFLVTDTAPEFYKKLGYIEVKPTITWLKIHLAKNYGLGTEKIDDAQFFIKPINGREWKGEHLDMLGYMY